MDDLKNLLVSRGTQLITRYVSKALILYTGYEAAKAGATGEVIASGIVAVVLSLMDLVIHKIAAAKQAQQQEAPKA